MVGVMPVYPFPPCFTLHRDIAQTIAPLMNTTVQIYRRNELLPQQEMHPNVTDI